MCNGLPHLGHKFVTNNQDAASVLKWAVIERTRRYELLHANGARNLADFNRKVEEGKPLRHPERPKPTLTSIAAEAVDTPPEPPGEEGYTDGMMPVTVITVDGVAGRRRAGQGEGATRLALRARFYAASLRGADEIVARFRADEGG